MIKPLTSLRFFFAFMVFLSHMEFSSVEAQTFNLSFDIFYFSEGYIGVSFFFILSGFILAFNYKQKFLEGKVSVKQFWVARVARIYPLHVLTFILVLPITIKFILSQSVSIGILKFLCNILLLQSFVPNADFYFSFNALSWSLSCEMFFYLMFPMLIIFLSKKKSGMWLALIAIILIPIGIHFCSNNLVHQLFYINPLFRIVDFVLGILLFELFQRNLLKNVTRNKNSATLIEFLAIALFIFFLSLRNIIPQGYRYSCYYWMPMIFIIYSFAHQKGLLSDLLSNKVFVILGEISFGFYLLHLLCIRYILIINSKLPVIQNNYLLVSIIFITSIILSYYSYKKVETPANRYIKKLWLNKPVINAQYRNIKLLDPAIEKK